MSGQPSTRWDQTAVLAHLKRVAEGELNMPVEMVSAINPDAPLLDAMPLDSLAQVVLMSAIERDFGCVFDPIELQGVETIRQLSRLICERATREPAA
jgi:acyl carrier protein